MSNKIQKEDIISNDLTGEWEQMRDDWVDFWAEENAYMWATIRHYAILALAIGGLIGSLIGLVYVITH